MTTWVALLRGINVGGTGILPMKVLVDNLTALGMKNVRTYIQSGNVVFDYPRRSAERVADDIGDKIYGEHGFRPFVLAMRRADLEAAIAGNPFPKAERDPKSLHLFFLASPPSADMKRLNEITSPTERFALVDKVLYLYAPDGIGRSKLAARVEKLLGVPATARNWRTVTKVRDLMQTA